MLLFYARRYDESIRVSEKALELDPNFRLAHWAIAASLIENGRSEAAVSEMEEVVRITNRMPFYLQILGYCYAKAGRREEALRIIQELRECGRQRYIPAYWLLIIHAGLNERDEAFRLLDAAYREHEPWMVCTKYWPLLDPLRSDPRLDDVLRRMNFP
jgi:pentatricopeptide repeat protein